MKTSGEMYESHMKLSTHTSSAQSYDLTFLTTTSEHILQQTSPQHLE